mgnify:CR=1 FL=1
MSLKQKLKNNELTIGSWIMMGNPMSVEVMALAGFEWLVIDIEHTSIDLETTQALITTIQSKGLKMPEKLEKILECIEDIDFILNHNDFEITQTIEDKILKPAIKMNIVRIAEQFKKLKDDFEIKILKNFKNEDLKSMSDIFGNYDLDDISVENIIKNHLPTIKATIEKIREI